MLNSVDNGSAIKLFSHPKEVLSPGDSHYVARFVDFTTYQTILKLSYHSVLLKLFYSWHFCQRESFQFKFPSVKEHKSISEKTIMIVKR